MKKSNKRAKTMEATVAYTRPRLTDEEIQHLLDTAPPRRAKSKLLDADVTYRTVLRLPMPTANRLKKGAEKYELSLNSTIETILEVWLDHEGL